MQCSDCIGEGGSTASAAEDGMARKADVCCVMRHCCFVLCEGPTKSMASGSEPLPSSSDPDTIITISDHMLSMTASYSISSAAQTSEQAH